MRMPYGKFKGKEIEDIPSWYLKWIAEQFNEKDRLGSAICLAADTEWQYREQYDEHIK